MNLNQIVNMLTRMLTRRAVNWSLNKARQKPGKAAAGAKPATQSNEHRAAVKRARQAARLTRRIGR